MSKEGILSLDAFDLSSQGIGASGALRVFGRQSHEGVTELGIDAFGRQFRLDARQLARLAGFAVNGLQLSFEQGYEALGGRTLYLVLSKGFTSGVVGQRFVLVNERGVVEVLEALDQWAPQ